MTYIPGRPSPKQALTPPMTPRCSCYGFRHPLGASACPGAHLAASPARAEDHRTLPTCGVCQAATTAARRTAFSARLSRVNANEPLTDQNGGDARVLARPLSSLAVAALGYMAARSIGQASAHCSGPLCRRQIRAVAGRAALHTYTSFLDRRRCDRQRAAEREPRSPSRRSARWLALGGAAQIAEFCQVYSVAGKVLSRHYRPAAADAALMVSR
jgi:hypothetical protein